MARTACLVCLVSTVSGRPKNALRRSSTNSEHIKLEQSRFSFDIYGWWPKQKYWQLKQAYLPGLLALF
jgi:hypothetical protein